MHNEANVPPLWAPYLPCDVIADTVRWRNIPDEALHVGEKALRYEVSFWRSEMLLTQVKDEYLLIKQIQSLQKF